ncbi:MAG: PaaI family thioesterase [Paralcaligenes sp.]
MGKPALSSTIQSFQAKDYPSIMAQLPIENPFLEWLGVTLTEWSPGYAEMRLPVTSKLGNRSKRVHGGTLCTLLDSVAGYCGLFAPPEEPLLQSVTLSLTTHFINSGEGTVLVAKGYIERAGRSIYFSRGEVWLDNTLLLATALGSFKYLRTRDTNRPTRLGGETRD